MVAKEIRNLTPHALRFFREEDVVVEDKGRVTFLKEGATPFLVVEPSGQRTRLQIAKEVVGNFLGVQVESSTRTLSEVPPEEEGVAYVDSFQAASAVRKEYGRKDFFSPGSGVKDRATGNIVGCLGLSTTE